MPTYAGTPRFRLDYSALTPQERRQFRVAVSRLVEDLRSGRLRKGLRVKAYRRIPGWFEMTWAADGRALFSFGEPVIAGERHIVWQRIGTHEIFDNP